MTESYFCFSELWASSPREFLGYYTSTSSNRFPGIEHSQTKQMNKQQLGSYSQEAATEVIFNVFPKVRGSNISLQGFDWGSNFLPNNRGFCLGIFLQEAWMLTVNTPTQTQSLSAVMQLKTPQTFLFHRRSQEDLRALFRNIRSDLSAFQPLCVCWGLFRWPE